MTQRPEPTDRTPSPAALTAVRRHLAGLAALYVPSVVERAALLLEDLREVAAAHGVAVDGEAYALLSTVAAESISTGHDHRGDERTIAELHALTTAFAAACDKLGLERAPSELRMGTGVAPVPGGPGWGLGGAAGLAVLLYLDSGWELAVNSPRSRVMSIYAPTTEAGAREVAELVAEVLRGGASDPFRTV